jgi:hypothetical protein
MDYQFRD